MKKTASSGRRRMSTSQVRCTCACACACARVCVHAHLAEEVDELRLEDGVGKLVLDGLLNVVKAEGADAPGQELALVLIREETEASLQTTRGEMVCGFRGWG